MMGAAAGVGYGVRMAVLAQLVGAVLMVAAVWLVWGLAAGLGLAGVMLVVGGLIAEVNGAPQPGGGAS